MLRETRPVGKGVGFSDELIVLGPPLPKGKVFVHRGEVAEERMMQDPCADDPHKPRTLSEQFEHTVVSEHSLIGSVPSVTIPREDVVLRPPGKKRARFVEHAHEGGALDACEESLETSCTDSDVSEGKRGGSQCLSVGLLSEEDLRKCTKINTRLNSMPSGGDFSFMNSSEDVHSATTSETSSEDDDLISVRRMIRVDGSAKLSSASGLGDDDFPAEEDEFGIEGAERVEEEEAVQVRSFGRSFAKVWLRDGEDVIIKDPRREKRQSEVTFAAEHEDERREYIGDVGDATTEHDDDNEEEPSCQDLVISKSAPPRRKSRLKIPLTRWSSTDSSSKPVESQPVKPSRGAKEGSTRGNAEDNENESDALTESDFGPGSCFPNRKTTLLRQRAKTMAGERPPQGQRRRSLCYVSGGRRARNCKDSKVGKERTVVAVPDMDEEVRGQNRDKEERKMVKNVSLQRDDWIEFATNAAKRQKHPWLVRLVSSNGRPSGVGVGSGVRSNDSSEETEGKTSNGRRRRFLKWLRKK